MTYDEAKAHKAALEGAVRLHSNALASFQRGRMGLVPDVVRTSPAYREAKMAYDVAFAELRQFNRWFTVQFRDECQAERRG